MPIYCPGCNERFRRVSFAGVCPRCGVEADDIPEAELAKTLLLHGDSRDPGGALPMPGEDDTLIDLADQRLGVYRCGSLLGCGGVGRVYLAHHGELDRKCALKVLSPRLVENDPDYVRRFRQEGRAAAALVHPNIVTTHALGESRGFHFLEMELVSGRSLQQLIDDEGRLTPVRATALAARIAEGLACAHRAGIVHRDLKPDNIMLTHQGIPKITDFGLAKRVVSDEGQPVSEYVGTPHFMSPESFQSGAATPTTDVYALGACYFLLLAGRHPFVARSLRELIHKVSSEPLPNLRDLAPGVSLEMSECVSLLMAKAPSNRPGDGIEAAQLLHAVSGHVRDIESLLLEAFGRGGDVSWERQGTRYELSLTLPDGRRQRLFVEPSNHAAVDRLLLFYSVCCDANPEYYEEALKLNSELAHGALALRRVDDQLKFVMVDACLRANVDTESVRRTALDVAIRADAVEKLLTGLDRN